MRYTREDVETHGISYSSKSLPAVNVKAYHFPSSNEIADRFNCSEEIAEQAGQYAFEALQEVFWEQAQEEADAPFAPRKVKVWSEGRSSGWLVVEGLPDIDTWDAIALSQWRKFERSMKGAVKDFCSFEVVADLIEANRWAEEGAERYNFFERKDHTMVCIADANRAAEKARNDVLRGGN